MSDRPRFKRAGRVMMSMGLAPLILLALFFGAVQMGATFGLGSMEIAWLIVLLGIVSALGLVFSAVGFVISLL